MHDEIPAAAVMPAYQAEHLLPTTLPPLLAAARGHVVVVDPGSSDGTAALAEHFGARVVRLGARAGPAEARNAGVAALARPPSGPEVVLFVDADCLIHPDALERVRAAFAADPALVSLTGSYDDEPSETNFASSYMNLRHHWVHQRANRERATFWAGCGAVRRGAFDEAGGFDAARYPAPMIEDIELGLRLRPLGATRLDPELQVKHLKRWTLSSVVATDILKRAVPWSELILGTGEMPDDLNLRRSQRFAALLAPFALLALPMLVVSIALSQLLPALACALVLALSLAVHGPMLAFFARRRGLAFAASAWIFHQVHLAYSGATFAWCALRHRFRGAGEAGRA